MFERIKEIQNKFGKLRKKLSYKMEKQLAITFYSDMALIFSFDKEMIELCREMNKLLREDKNFNNLELCHVVNNKIKSRMNYLEKHKRKARIWLKKKAAIIRELDKKVESFKKSVIK